MDRKKVIGIFSGFLAVMLLFTILSRAVTGASMARVETVKIKTGTIDHKVTGSGRVEAGKEIAVYTESGQRVKEIFVREGQSVEAGEVLFTVDLEELQEQILAAEQELEKSRLQECGTAEPGTGKNQGLGGLQSGGSRRRRVCSSGESGLGSGRAGVAELSGRRAS